MAITADDLAKREVHYCVSQLIANTAALYGEKTPTLELGDMAEQAFELCTPIANYDDAAIDEGYRQSTIGFWFNGNKYDSEAEALGEGDTFETASEVCDEYGIEPYDREIYEHWIVSDWLADKLEAKGEKVDKDFAGLTIWARTTTGQGIANDWVIEQIARDINAA